VGRPQEEVREVVQQINHAWSEGRIQDLNPFFHEHAVIVGPDYQELSRGRVACVKSYADFLSHAKVIDHHEGEPAIDVWGSMAIATYRWKMSYDLSGLRYREKGHDTFAFINEDRRWQAVWRLMLVEP
jgi:hypothetical protein